jgi:flagellar motility protein MotE (MotC chaperone)
MDIDTLLLVIDSMNERRAASVLANMSPKKAMNLTVELTEYRKLSAVSENETKVAR